MRIAIELNKNNIILSVVYNFKEDYSSLLDGDSNYVLADINNLEDIVEYKTKYEDGTFILLEDYCQEYYDIQTLEEQRQQIQQAIQEIEQWFNEYDLQIKQYERDVRLGVSGTYHIGNNTYTIQQLDQTAISKAQQISNLREQLARLG